MKLSAYQQRAVDQGKTWVNGKSEHNAIDNECCPDFSCCVPSLFTKDRADRVVVYNSWAGRNGFPKVVDA